LILPVFLFTQAGFRDIMKIPAMVCHYFEHTSNEPDLNFAEFLHNHYCKSHAHEHEHNHCGKLPFEDDDLPLPHFHVITENPDSFFSYVEINLTIEKSFYQDQTYAAVSLDFWQPPKV
jgi:hypothetical protein